MYCNGCRNEKIIGLQNRRFNNALFIDLKMLQFFKVIIRIQSISKEPDGKGLTDCMTINMT